MKKLMIVTICSLFLFMSCAAVDKKSEVPNPAANYIEKVKKNPLAEIFDWAVALEVLTLD